MIVIQYLLAALVNTALEKRTWVSEAVPYRSTMHGEICLKVTLELLVEFVLYKIILKPHMLLGPCNNITIG